MHRTERNFTQCFCVVFIWRYPFFHYRPFSARNVNLQFPQKENFRRAQSKVSFNSVSWVDRIERNFTERFCEIFIWRYTFFHNWPLSAPNVQLQFLQAECFRTAEKMYASTLLVECTEQKVVSQNASVLFLFEDIPFSTIGLLALGMSTCSFYRKSVSELLN